MLTDPTVDFAVTSRGCYYDNTLVVIWWGLVGLDQSEERLYILYIYIATPNNNKTSRPHSLTGTTQIVTIQTVAVITATSEGSGLVGTGMRTSAVVGVTLVVI